MSGSKTPAEVLRAARQRDSRDKRAKVLAVVEDMVRREEPVTFAAVAKEAGVSNWLVYAEGVRERIEQARRQQADRPRRNREAGISASPAGLKTDLALARQEIDALRAEPDRLRGALQRNLGQQLDQISSKTLVERVDELTAANRGLVEENRRLRNRADTLEARVTEAEDDLAAARDSLRRMIRSQNLPGDG